jgi:ketosteroid isomerase-like protein
MVQTRACLVVLPLLLILGCSPSAPATSTTDTAASQPVDTAADQAALAKAHDVVEGAYRTSDCNAMVSVAMNDAVFEPPNTPTAKGIDGITAWCQPLFSQMKTKTLTVSNKEVDISGDLAVDHGDYDWTLTPAKGGTDQRIQGRYVTIWHRQTDGSWKMSRLIWNSSQPAPRS